MKSLLRVALAFLKDYKFEVSNGSPRVRALRSAVGVARRVAASCLLEGLPQPWPRRSDYLLEELLEAVDGAIADLRESRRQAGSGDRDALVIIAASNLEQARLVAKPPAAPGLARRPVPFEVVRQIESQREANMEAFAKLRGEVLDALIQLRAAQRHDGEDARALLDQGIEELEAALAGGTLL